MHPSGAETAEVRAATSHGRTVRSSAPVQRPRLPGMTGDASSHDELHVRDTATAEARGGRPPVARRAALVELTLVMEMERFSGRRPAHVAGQNGRTVPETHGCFGSGIPGRGGQVVEREMARSSTERGVICQRTAHMPGIARGRSRWRHTLLIVYPVLGRPKASRGDVGVARGARSDT